MIKRKAAVFFILLANILLLAHAVIPHHHHQSIFCIAATFCQEHNLAQKHNHQQDSNTNNTACILKQAVIIPSSQEKLLKSCDIGSDNTNHDFYLPSNYGYADFQPAWLSESSVPGISSFFNLFVNRSHGLRAPPVI